MIQDAHRIVADFKAAHLVDDASFQEWFRDGRYPQDMANVHDSRYLALLETYVDERDTGTLQ